MIPDDELPFGIEALDASISFIARRGWIGDALATRSGRVGLRIGLLVRAKQPRPSGVSACLGGGRAGLGWPIEGGAG